MSIEKDYILVNEAIKNLHEVKAWYETVNQLDAPMNGVDMVSVIGSLKSLFNTDEAKHFKHYYNYDFDDIFKEYIGTESQYTAGALILRVESFLKRIAFYLKMDIETNKDNAPNRGM